MIRREFDEDMDLGEREEWRGWFLFHGIDPFDVPLGSGWVEVDGRVIRYLSLVRQDGRPVGDGQGLKFQVQEKLARAVPLPFPRTRL